MKIASVRIENFRSFKDATIPLNNFACLVGPNGAGKSTVLTALNLFFRQTEDTATNLSKLDREDFHRKETGSPIIITVTFTDLDEEAQADFADYVRQGQLVVSAVATYDQESGVAAVKQFGQRLGILAFAPFFEADGDGKNVAELKEIYLNLQETFTDLPKPGPKNAMVQALGAYEVEHPNDCELISSEDQFYGFTRGSNRLAKHIQWVYVPAVKDATSEQVDTRDSALRKLLVRTVRSRVDFDHSIDSLRTQMQDKYQELLDENQSTLDELSTALQSRLEDWAHPNAKLRLQWRQDLEKSVRVDQPQAHILVGEGEFEGELARFGHGFQRSYLLALLQELAATGSSGAPTLILACEEPELYQHPPQARHLAAVLHDLSHHSSQVIISTHSPLFVSGERFEDVRLVRKDSGSESSSVAHMSLSEIASAVGTALGKQPTQPEGVLAKINQALQSELNEMFFARRLVLVEGREDIAYILAYVNLMERSNDYRRLGCHIVPANGKNQLLQPLVIAKHMNIPTYLVFDGDVNKAQNHETRAKITNDNSALLTLADMPDPEPMPEDTYWGNGVTMWRSDIATVVQSEIGQDQWEKFGNEARRSYGDVGWLQKNALYIATTLTLAWKAGKCSNSLKRVCDQILTPDNRIPF